MPFIYSNPAREGDVWALPDVQVFEMTPEDVAQEDGDLLREYLKRFPLAAMNSREHEKMLAAMIEEEGIVGGWTWWSCFPGCLPDSGPMGIYATREEAEAAARDFFGE